MADAENDDAAFENLQSPPTTGDDRAIAPLNNILPLTSVSPWQPPVTASGVGVDTHTLVHPPLPLNDEDTPPQTIQSVSSLGSMAEAPSLQTHASITTTRALGDQSSTQLSVTANDESQLTVENSETANSSFFQGLCSYFFLSDFILFEFKAVCNIYAANIKHISCKHIFNQS